MRWVHPTPRMQIFNAAVAHDVDGYPIYEVEYEHVDRRNRDCPSPDTLDVIVAGDSVFANIHEPGLGSPDDDDDVVALQLHRGLRARNPKVCALDVSEPGYGPMQQWIAARQAHERYGAEALVVGVWKPHVALTRLAGDWYLTGNAETGSDGTPKTWWWPVPDALHTPLFKASESYRLLALTPVQEVSQPEEEQYGAWVQFAEWARGEGIATVFVEMPPLHQSFDATLAARADIDQDHGFGWRRSLQGEVEALGFPYRLAADWLRHLDHEEIRLDTCCHLQRSGHEVLGRHLVDEVEALWASEESTAE